MSTLEVACGRCEKKFRVRAEFAGRSTRCPGCSAPLTIAGAARSPPAPRPAEEDRPRPRPREDEDDAPRRPAVNWAPADAAFRREQVAIICALLSVLGGFFASCAGAVLGRAGGEGPAIAVIMLFAVGPALATAAFGLMARLSALGIPREGLARGSAVASLLCSIAGLVSLVGLALAFLMSIDTQRHDELPMLVALGGLVLSGLGSVGTFFGLVAQVGIALRSAAVSRAVGRSAVATAVCVLVLLAISTLYTLAMEATTPSYPYGGYYHPDHSGFAVVMFGALLPMSFGVWLILYHRLLGAGRRAIQGGPDRRYEE